MKLKKTVFALVICIFLLHSSYNYNASSISIERDYWPTNSWQDATFSEVDLNQQTIESMLEYIATNDFDIDSILLVKNGYLVVEEYPRYYTSNTMHIVYSVTKSFMSTLIGIAIEEGYIDSVNQRIMDFFQNVTVPNIESKENITIAHLLTMTSGIEWEEDISYLLPENSFRQMKESDNWIEFILSREMANEPGTAFKYNSGASHLLSAIIENATGDTSLQYLKDHIFDPLGISRYFWEQDPQGLYFGGSDLHLLPQDMAKFGFLFLNNGSWNGTQLVPEEWVINASNDSVAVSDWSSYGYQWWVYPQINSYLALGWAGQIIQIIPEFDIVAVFTSSLSESQWPFVTLIVDYIIQAAAEGYIEETSFESTLIILSFVITSSFVLRKSKKNNN